MKQWLILILLIPLLLATNSCKRTIYEEIPPQLDTDPNIILFEKPIISDRVVLVTEKAQIKSFTANKIVFKSFVGMQAVRDENRGGRVGDYDISDLKAGAILVAYGLEGAAEGFLVEVVSVVQDGTDIIVEYVDAQLEALFKDVHFKFSIPQSYPFPFENKIKVDGAVDEQGRNTFVELGYSGLYEKAFKTDFELQIKDSQVQLFSFLNTETTTTRLRITESVGVEGRKKRSYNKSIADLPLGYFLFVFRFQIGIIPLRVNVALEAKGEVNAKVKSLAIDYQMIDKRLEKISGIVWQNGTWQEVDRIISDIDNKPAINSVSVEGEVKASVTGSLNVSFYNQNKGHKTGTDFDGVSAEVSYFGKLTGYCDTEKGLGVRGTTGWEGRVYSQFSFLPRLLNHSFDFAITPETVRLNVTIPGVCSDSETTPAPIPNDLDRTATAVSTSDPHLTTFDFNRYSFMAAGEFTAAKSTSDNFEVQARQQEIPAKSNNGTVSWNTGLAIRMGNDDVCIYPPSRVFVNRQAIGSSFTTYNLSGSGKITKENNELTISNTAGDEIRVKLFDSNLDYYFTPNPNRKGKFRGLLGNYDGNPANDLVLSTGVPVQNTYESLYPAFTDSWRIKQTESLFVYDTDKNTESYTDRTFPRKPISFTAAQREAARQACVAAGVTDPVLLENCIIDMASTNNNDYTLPARHYDSQLTAQVLNSFAIGGFSTSDVQLDYYGATAKNNQAVLDTKADGFSRILMKQGVNIKKGFITEFSFSTSELNSTSCFFLALWPTEAKTRNLYQKRAGFCFTSANGIAKAFFQIDQGAGLLAEKVVPNFVDSNAHKVRIIETQLSNQKWRVQLFLDDMTAPKLSVDNSYSLADEIQARNDVGYIEFQINQGMPSVVNLFNWKFGAL